MNPRVTAKDHSVRKHKYDIDSVNLVLKSKGMDTYVTAVSIDNEKDIVVLEDKEYGTYSTLLKSLCPKSSIPIHKTRKHLLKMQAHKDKYVGKDIKGLKVLDVFYGPDRGYKNRSFYIEYVGTCGHTSIGTRVGIMNHKTNFECHTCVQTTHGGRGKENGVRKPRTSTYTYWMRVHKRLPQEYWDFGRFRAVAGDKPYKKAEVRLVEGRLVWIDLQVGDEYEVNLIAIAVRQAFRYSSIYRNAIKAASVETSAGTRYVCAKCGEPVMRSQIEVDHIDPIKKLDGTSLTKEEIIPRVWTNNLAILDKTCHSKKTLSENKIRNAAKREHKKARKK